jgi:murein DD-endopeptidase MepM/ murein hydrolase activator NlpD
VDPAVRERAREAGRALEAMVLKTLVASSKAFKGGESAGSGIREDLFATTLADALVNGGGIGLAAQVEHGLLGEAPAPPAPGPGPQTQLPVARLSGPVTSAFGIRADPFTGQPTMHHGIDVAAPEGTEVRAALDGVVRVSGQRGGYGLAVELVHDGGLTTLYAHASELLVRDGERVTRGQPIARVGQTGRATGPHLHLEVRQADRAVDPRKALRIYGARAEDAIGSES